MLSITSWLFFSTTLLVHKSFSVLIKKHNRLIFFFINVALSMFLIFIFKFAWSSQTEVLGSFCYINLKNIWKSKGEKVYMMRQILSPINEENADCKMLKHWNLINSDNCFMIFMFYMFFFCWFFCFYSKYDGNNKRKYQLIYFLISSHICPLKKCTTSSKWGELEILQWFGTC